MGTMPSTAQVFPS